MGPDNAPFLGPSIFVAVLAVYARTSFPSVTGGDAGELLAEACQLGTAHPPGYPLFTGLIHVAMRGWTGSGIGPGHQSEGSVPPGAPARAANLLCAAFGAGAAALVFATVVEWNTGRRLPEASQLGGVVAAALFSFSPLAWEYHTGAEVFALNNFLVALLLYLTARVASGALANCPRPLEGRSMGSSATLGQGGESSSGESISAWGAEQRGRRPGARRAWVAARWGALVCGLALSNQHASLLFIVPLAAAVSSAPLPSPKLVSAEKFALCRKVQKGQSQPHLVAVPVALACHLALSQVLAFLALAEMAVPSRIPSGVPSGVPSSGGSAGAAFPWWRFGWRVAGLVGCFLAGVSPYGYLVGSARAGPKPGSWGDTRTAQGFFKHGQTLKQSARLKD